MINYTACTSAGFWTAFGTSASVILLAALVGIVVSIYSDWVNGRSLKSKALLFFACSFAFAMCAGAAGASNTFDAIACVVPR